MCVIVIIMLISSLMIIGERADTAWPQVRLRGQPQGRWRHDAEACGTRVTMLSASICWGKHYEDAIIMLPSVVSTLIQRMLSPCLQMRPHMRLSGGVPCDAMPRHCMERQCTALTDLKGNGTEPHRDPYDGPVAYRGIPVPCHAMPRRATAVAWGFSKRAGWATRCSTAARTSRTLAAAPGGWSRTCVGTLLIDAWMLSAPVSSHCVP